jgi:hypothetical protein
MARTVKLYKIETDGRRMAAGAFRVNSESDLQAKWELYLATAAGGLYVATSRRAARYGGCVGRCAAGGEAARAAARTRCVLYAVIFRQLMAYLEFHTSHSKTRPIRCLHRGETYEQVKFHEPVRL